MKVSICLASLAPMYSVTSKPLTSPAIWLLSTEASKRVTRPMPERPWMRLSQAVWTSLPTGDTMPNPVMTTRRFTDSAPETGNERGPRRSEEHTSELQSRENLVCRLLLEKKKNKIKDDSPIT